MTAGKGILLMDVGGTFIKAGVACPGGELPARMEYKAPVRSEGGRDEILDSIRQAVVQGQALISEAGLEVAGIGVAMPGPFDYDAGVPRMTHKFGSIYGVSLRDFILHLPGMCPGLTVAFAHDVNMALLGEMVRGNAAGCGNAALVTLGTGLGFACSIGGNIQYSPEGSPLLTIYKTPYRDGIMEDYVSKRGMLREYGRLSGIDCPDVTVEEMAARAMAGDAAALGTFEATGAVLGAKLAELLPGLGTECLLFGGQISKSFCLMEKQIRGHLSALPGLHAISVMKNMDTAALYGMLHKMTSGARPGL